MTEDTKLLVRVIARSARVIVRALAMLNKEVARNSTPYYYDADFNKLLKKNGIDGESIEEELDGNID